MALSGAHRIGEDVGIRPQGESEPVRQEPLRSIRLRAALARQDGDHDAGGHAAPEQGRAEQSHQPAAQGNALAAKAIGEWRLSGATLAATLEPCPMCAGAAQSARVARVVFGADDPKSGACGSLYNLGADPRLNHEYEVVGSVRGAQCAARLAEFFAELRNGSAG